jgi:GT2 family glycosyltransferase
MNSRVSEQVASNTRVKVADSRDHASRVRVSVAIVKFNGGQMTRTVVESVLSSTVPVEVFVADNGSKDDSVESLRRLSASEPRLRLIENGRNLGFTRATNICVGQARSEYLLLLNPDCVVKPDTLQHMLGAMAAYPNVGMAGCLIRNPDGSEQAGCRRAVPTPWRALVRIFHLNRLFPSHPRFRTFLLNLDPLPDKPIFVEAISGAFMLLKRQAIEQVGLLDEGYFLHCEDLDWCMRFRAAGWKILFVPDAEVVHYKGTSSRPRPIFVEWHKHRGMLRFYRKFFRHQYPGVLMWLVVLGVWLRFGVLAGYHSLQRLGRRVRALHG